MSYARLKQLEKVGVLRPIDARSVGFVKQSATGRPCTWVYAAKDVETCSQRRQQTRTRGRLAAVQAFIMFREGKTIEDVVIELAMHPHVARDLHKNWVEATGAVTLSATVVRAIRDIGFEPTHPKFARHLDNFRTEIRALRAIDRRWRRGEKPPTVEEWIRQNPPTPL